MRSSFLIVYALGVSAAAAETLQLTRKQGKTPSTLSKVWASKVKGLNKRQTETVPEVDDGNFWFANFTIGSSQSLEILIDSGSSDVYLNPGVYQPSNSSQDLNQTFQITFATTNSDGSGVERLTGSLYRDFVETGDLSYPTQELGSVTNPASPPAFPHDGLIGFAGPQDSAFHGTPWFSSLCNASLVDECRFGLAFNTDGTGTQELGTVDPAYANNLSVAPILDEWMLYGDVAVNDSVIKTLEDVRIITDSGTSVVYGPIDDVQAIFDSLDIPTYLSPAGNNQPAYLYGYFPCSNPPTVGFAFPSTSSAANASPGSIISNTSTIFNIAPEAWSVSDNGNNNCTAVLQGTDQFGAWLIGQAFFQGHYIDHNVDQQTMGFANLK